MRHDPNFAKPSKVLTKDILYQKFIVEKKSVEQIQKEMNIKNYHCVYLLLRKFKLKRPRLYSALDNVTKEYLYQSYVIEQKSVKDVGKGMGTTSHPTVLKALKMHGIPLRKEVPKNESRRRGCLKRSKGYGDIYSRYFNSLKRGAIERNLEFSITIEEIWELFLKQDRKCALSGTELTFKDCFGTETDTQTASLDRIDSLKGYTIDNVQWIHKKLNRMKWNIHNTEFIEWCILTVKHQGYIVS